MAYKILTNPVEHFNKTYLLTGGLAMNYGQVAEAIGIAIGEKVEYISLSIDETKQRMTGNGMPAIMINTFIAIAEGQRNGNADFVNTVGEDLLGKKLITVEQFAKDYSTLFK